MSQKSKRAHSPPHHRRASSPPPALPHFTHSAKGNLNGAHQKSTATTLSSSRPTTYSIHKATVVNFEVASARLIRLPARNTSQPLTMSEYEMVTSDLGSGSSQAASHETRVPSPPSDPTLKTLKIAASMMGVENKRAKLISLDHAQHKDQLRRDQYALHHSLSQQNSQSSLKRFTFLTDLRPTLKSFSRSKRPLALDITRESSGRGDRNPELKSQTLPSSVRTRPIQMLPMSPSSTYPSSGLVSLEVAQARERARREAQTGTPSQQAMSSGLHSSHDQMETHTHKRRFSCTEDTLLHPTRRGLSSTVGRSGRF